MSAPRMGRHDGAQMKETGADHVVDQSLRRSPEGAHEGEKGRVAAKRWRARRR